MASCIMFRDFANVWTIVAPAAHVTADKMVPLTIAGERVVLFRDASGRASALIDRCPHRGVQLSLGKLHDGIVECPFHGWRFDGGGNNCGVPWNPDAKTDQLRATALPVREREGLIWLFTGRATNNEPAPSPSLSRPGVVLTAQSVTWAAHWTRVMENMLDMPHLPFVHARTIGRGMDGPSRQSMDIAWTPAEWGATIEGSFEQGRRPTRLEFRYPNTMELTIDPPGRMLRMLAVCVPEADNRTRLTIVTIRDFARSPLMNPVFRWTNRRIAREDQAIVESSSPCEVPPAGEERSVRTDAPTLAFRKLYFERLKGSEA